MIELCFAIITLVKHVEGLKVVSQIKGNTGLIPVKGYIFFDKTFDS